MTQTVIILNPNAASGRAGKSWDMLRPLLETHFSPIHLIHAEGKESTRAKLASALENETARIISIGGDGTNHVSMNILISLYDEYPHANKIPYGWLPVGTGNDLANYLSIPSDLEEAVKWLASAKPQQIDIGLLSVDGTQTYFLNVSSAGISGDIATRVNRVVPRRGWTFLKETLIGLALYNEVPLKVWVDDELWYEGTTYILAVANGTTFGAGMQVAPNAKIDDGLFDVLVLKKAPLWQILRVIASVYKGKHLTSSKIQHRNGKTVRIQAEQVITYETDGEPGTGREFLYEMKPQFLSFLTQSVEADEK